MARATIAVDNALLRQIRQRASRNGKTLTAEVNALLRQALAVAPRPGYRPKLATWDGEQARGVDLFDRHSLFEWMEKG